MKAIRWNKKEKEVIMGVIDFFRPKWNHSLSEVRLAAVKNLEDKSILANIAQNAKYADARKTAVEKLEDKSILTNIAKSDEHENVRLAAVMLLEDQSVLTEIARNDQHIDVRKTAVEKLEDKLVLADIAKKDRHDGIAMAARKKLEDQFALFIDIANNAKSKETAKNALREVVERFLLAKDILRSRSVLSRYRIEANYGLVIRHHILLTKIKDIFKQPTSKSFFDNWEKVAEFMSDKNGAIKAEYKNRIDIIETHSLLHKIIETPSLLDKIEATHQTKEIGNNVISKASFLRAEINGDNRYEIYSASNLKDALDFLRQQEVKEERRYVIVETPEGNLGKDLMLIFNEKTNEVLELGIRKPMDTPRKSRTHCTRCGYSVIPRQDGPLPITCDGPMTVHEMVIGEELKKDGGGFYCQECETIWCAICILPSGEEQPRCGICGKTMRVF